MSLLRQETAAAAPQDPALEAAFGGCLTIDMPTTARLAGMDIKTLRRHLAALAADGTAIGRFKGLGRKRRHRVFTRADVARLLQAEEATPCPSIATPARRTGNSTFSGVVLDFPARPGSRTNVTRRNSKTPKRPKPRF